MIEWMICLSILMGFVSVGAYYLYSGYKVQTIGSTMRYVATGIGGNQFYLSSKMVFWRKVAKITALFSVIFLVLGGILKPVI